MKVAKSRVAIAYVCAPILFIHLLFFLLSPNRKAILSDLGEGGGIKLLIYRLLFDKPYRNVFYYRIGRIHFMFSWLLPRRSDMKINQNMPIGFRLKNEHSFCTFLNAVSIGDDFSCWHNVTIGNMGGQIPTIGNHVTMSCGSSVLGGVHIGDNVIIGSGCVVTKDVPSNCTVIGNPAHIVKLNGERVDILL